MYEQNVSPLPYVQYVWRAEEVADGEAYDDPGKDTWGIAFTKKPDGEILAELLGPSFHHRQVDSALGHIYWGVEFYLHVTMRGIDKKKLLGQFIQLPVREGQFFIGNDAYDIPRFEDLEVFCERLAEQGTLYDDVYDAARLAASERTRQRQHLAHTGMTRKQLEQLQRAYYAAELLVAGKAPTDVASEAGYADQAHMTRSLKLLLGKTPSQWNG